MGEKFLQIRAKSRVAEVVAFSEGARVTREVDVSEIPEILDEPQEVVVSIDGVSPFAHFPEVKFIAKNPSDTLDIRHVSLREEEDDIQANEGALDKLQAQLAEKNQRLQTLEAQIQSRRKQANLLGNLAPSLQINGRNPRSKPSERMADVFALETTIHQVVSESDQVLLQLWQEAQTVYEEIQALEAQQSGTIQGNDSEKTTTKTLSVTFGGKGKLQRLVVTYSVKSARWWPGYAAKFSSGGKVAEISMDAFVVQASGEDWSSVRLKLSTANLNQDCRLPVLSSLRIGRAQSAQKSGFRSPPEALDELFSSWDGSKLAAKSDAKMSRATLNPVKDAFDDDDDSSHPWRMNDQTEKLLCQLFDDDDEEEVSKSRSRRTSESRVSYCPECGARSGQCNCDQIVEETEDGVCCDRDVPLNFSPVMRQRNVSERTRGSRVVHAVARMLPVALEDGCERAPIPIPCCSTPMISETPMRPGSSKVSGGAGQGFSEGKSVEKWMDFDGLVLRDGITSDKESRGKLALREDKNSDRRVFERANALDRLRRMTGPAFSRAPSDGVIRFDQVIDSDGVFDIPSDGIIHRIPMTSAVAPTTQSLVAVPVEKLAVYREANLTNPFQMPLLAGPLDVMFDGTLLSTTALQRVDVGGAISVGLGEENRVQVVRNVKSMESTRGVLGGQTQVQTSVTLEVRSFLAAPVDLTLFDRVPVSHSDDVKVTHDAMAQGSVSLSDQDRKRHASGEGGLKWGLTLDAGEKRAIKFDYTVTFSSKFELEGGNRRD